MINLIIFSIVILNILLFIHILRQRNNKNRNERSYNLFKGLLLSGLIFIFVISIVILSGYSNLIYSSETSVVSNNPLQSNGFGFLGAAIAVGLGSIGAGIAVGMAATAGLGAVSENPKLFGNALVFVGLAEGIAIYGLIVAIMILSKI